MSSSPAAAARQAKKGAGPVALKKVVSARRSHERKATFARPFIVKRMAKETNHRVAPDASLMNAAAVDYIMSLIVERAAAQCGTKKCLTVAHVIAGLKADSALNRLFHSAVGAGMGKIGSFSLQELNALVAADLAAEQDVETAENPAK